MDEKRPLRVCYFGTYREEYSRNQMIRAGLEAAGVELIECHERLWRGIEDRVAQASGGWRSWRFVQRVIGVYWRLLRRHRKTAAYDVMLIGYPGAFDAYLGRLLAWWRGVPMVLDHYMSLYLIAEERGLTQKSPATGWLIRTLEGIGLKLNNLLISDTTDYIAYHCRTYGLTEGQFALVPAGADDRFFYPRPALTPPTDSFCVLYYGTYIPNHGLQTVAQAAGLLKDRREIVFHFYGEGPERPLIEQLAQDEGANIIFHDWIEKEDLPSVMAQAHLCLGAFGQTPQSLMTVQNKIWEAAAMARPIVSGESAPVRAALGHKAGIYLVPRDEPAALAEAIVQLAQDEPLRQTLAQTAHARFVQNHTVLRLGEQMVAALRSVL